MSDTGWDCEAYGAVGTELGALCFLAGPGERVCSGPKSCALVMRAERVRVFRRIRELAAAGDPIGTVLADTFTEPDQLLGGGGGDVES